MDSINNISHVVNSRLSEQFINSIDCRHVLAPLDPKCLHCGLGITETDSLSYQYNALGGGKWVPLDPDYSVDDLDVDRASEDSFALSMANLGM